MYAYACSYLPSRRASPPFGRYQVILLDDMWHIGVNNLPKVVTQLCLEQDLNPPPTDRKPKCPTRCTTAPPIFVNPAPNGGA